MQKGGGLEFVKDEEPRAGHERLMAVLDSYAQHTGVGERREDLCVMLRKERLLVFLMNKCLGMIRKTERKVLNLQRTSLEKLERRCLEGLAKRSEEGGEEVYDACAVQVDMARGDVFRAVEGVTIALLAHLQR